MRSSNASRSSHGGTAPTARHAKHTFDEGEDDLFALSLDDVMSDRPWTADELMGGGARPTSAKPAPSATPAPASVPADDFATRPIVQTTRKTAPAPHPISDPSETAAFLAAAAQHPTADNTIRYDAPQQSAYTAPEYNKTGVKDASASSYTRGTDDERFADYYTEEEPPHFSEFPQAAKVVFIAIIIALLGVIAFEGFQLFRGPTAPESATQQKEDDNQYLDINTLKGDPNDGDE
jgi:hypothetical protein